MNDETPYHFNPEIIVGITEYSTSTPGIGGIVKQDISDFIVREITPSGEILSTREKEKSNIKFNPNRDRYTLFTLIKKKVDTIVAAKIIQRYLEIPLKNIKWAGIKDHTAISAQRFTVRGDYIQQLENFHHDNISLTNIRPCRDEMELGKLWGNHFTINIRKTQHPYSEIEPIIKEWADQINEKGFPNYFGTQRFGQHRPNSHLMGKAYFLQDYKKTCEEFLFTYYPKEFEQNALFRQKLKETRDYEQAINECPDSLHYEKLVIYKLAENPTDYKRAIDNLPTPLLNLLLSSFQSYIFNRALSQRLSEGYTLTKPIKGDLISILMEPQGAPSLVNYKYEGGKGWNDGTIEKAFNHNRAAIIAPIIGYQTDLTRFPYFQPIYKKILEEENFDLKQFNHTNRTLFHFEGTFRPIARRPSNLSFSQAHITNQYPKLDDNGINIEFSLPKGTYATILLRELRKFHDMDLLDVDV